jgi:hypothetical protein
VNSGVAGFDAEFILASHWPFYRGLVTGYRGGQHPPNEQTQQEQDDNDDGGSKCRAVSTSFPASFHIAHQEFSH